MDLQSAASGNDEEMGDRATDMLRADHAHVSELFEQYRQAMEEDAEGRESIAREICMELDLHTRIEEQVFYPAVRSVDEEVVDECIDEHADVKECIAIIEELTPADPEFDATMLRMMQLVEEHVAEEEGELFPMVEDQLDDQLTQLGDELQACKEELAGSTEDVEARS